MPETVTEKTTGGEVPFDGTAVTGESGVLDSLAWLSDAEINTEVERIHKTLTKKVVIPLMAVMTIAFYASGFQNTTYHIVIVILGLVIAALNAWISNKTEEWHFQSGWRTDSWDAGRWLVSVLGFDLFLLYGYSPSLTVTFSSWTILIVSAQSDLFNKRLRNVVVFLCWAAGAVAILIWYPFDPLGTRLFAILAMLLICVLFERLESYWCSELVRRRKIERIQNHAQERLVHAERDAQIGAQVRTVSHELGNLINILQLSNSLDSELNREQLTRTLFYITKINRLILRDIDKRAPRQEIRIKELMSDIVLLIRPEVITTPCRFQINASQDVLEHRINERTGSLFLIIHNLVRNGLHAINDAKLKVNHGKIEIGAELHGKEIRMTIADNGVGMSEQTLEQLFSGRSRSIKRGRHGLGFGFVLDECARNGFNLSVSSVPSEGTIMTMVIPVTA